MAESDPELEKWIDQALATYTDPHDDAVSYRINAGTLDRIDHWRRRRRRVRLFGLAGALGFACALIVVLLLRPSFNVQVPAAIHTTASLAAPAVHPVPAVVHPVPVSERRPAPMKRSAVLQAEAPKLDQFPTPYPLSAEEQAMVVFASLPGKQLKQLEQGPPTPIQIPSVKIPALQIKVLDVSQ